MTFGRRELGRTGEELTAEFLIANGFKILGENVSFFVGEIDLLAQDGKTIVIVEVKTKTSDEYGRPEEMLTFKKKQKLLQLGRVLLQKYPGKNIRIDVSAVDMSVVPPKINYIKNAVYDN